MTVLSHQPLRLRLFGDFELVVDTGNAAPFSVSSPAQRMLAHLAMARSTTLRRDVVMESVWPDLDSATAGARLSQTLWRLKKILGDHALPVAATRTHLALAPDLLVDLHEFNRCRQAPPEERRSALFRALELHRGPLLEFSDDEALWVPRQSLENDYAAVARELITALVEEDEVDEALRVAERWIERQPLAEGPYRESLQLLERAGLATDALRVFSRLGRRQSEELGVGASADHIEAGRLRSDDAGPPRGSDLGTTTAPRRLVGRGHQRAAVLEVFDLAEDGFGSVVFIEADVGMGKSRLAEELLRDAIWRGSAAGLGRCSPTTAPFGPMVSALTQAMSPTEMAVLSEQLDPRVRMQAERLLPNLRWPRAAGDPPPTFGPILVAGTDSQRGHRHTIVSLVRALASLRPVCLMIEDVHLADPGTLDTISDLVQEIGDLAAALVLTSRPEGFMRPDVAKDLRRVVRAEHTRRISLDGLDLRGVLELARATDRSFPVERARELLESTDGIPLLVVHAVDDHSPDGADDNPIHAKIARLNPTELAVLQTLGVFGEWLSVLALVRTLDEHPAEHVVRATLNLVRLRLVSESRGNYRLSHERVLGGVEKGLTSTRSRQLAEALLRSADEEQLDPRRRAELATKAVDWRAAAEAHRVAGGEALALGAYEAAVAHYEALLVLSSEGALAEAEHIDIVLALHDIHDARGEDGERDRRLAHLAGLHNNPRSNDIELRLAWTDLDAGFVDRVIESGSRLCATDPLPARSLRGGPAALVIAAHKTAGQHREAVDFLDAIAPRLDDAELAEAQVAVAPALLELGDVDRATDVLGRAAGVFDAGHEIEGYIDAASMLAVAQLHAGGGDEWLDLLHDLVERCRLLGDRRRLGHVLMTLGSAYSVLRDDFGRGRAHLIEVHQLGRDHVSARPLLTSMNNLAFSESAALGRHEEGIALLLEAVVIAEETDDRLMAAVCRGTLGEVFMAMGDRESARTALHQSLREFTELGDAHLIESIHASLAELDAECGDLLAAEYHIDRAAELARERAYGESEVGVLIKWSRVLTLSGKPKAAAEKAREAVERLGPGVAHVHDVLWQAAEAHYAVRRNGEGDVFAGRAAAEAQRFVEGFDPALMPIAASRVRSIVDRGAMLRASAMFVELDLRDGTGVTTVRLTATPAELEGAATDRTLRHEVLARFLAEAESQRAVVDVGTLTDTLSVSSRTLQRDLRELRAKKNP